MPLDVGGQAVIAGVMMRSPRWFAVVCRRPNGQIVVKEDAWRPLWRNLKPLRWPPFRGAIVLLESLMNGISALTFSAEQQEAQEQKESAPANRVGMMFVSLLFAIALFVGTPHLAAWGLGTWLGFDATSMWFHLADGVIKMGILLTYLSAISLVPEIRRVFEYHGAEHKAIFTYEKGLPLTVENAREQTRFHPRCGTSFLLIVIVVSVVLFATLLRGQLSSTVAVDHALKIVLKIPLMFPIAGLSYEVIKLSGKTCDRSRVARVLATPGLWLQKITTREPSDEQLEIALISIRKTLWRERADETCSSGVTVYASAAEVDLPLA